MKRYYIKWHFTPWHEVDRERYIAYTEALKRLYRSVTARGMDLDTFISRHTKVI